MDAIDDVSEGHTTIIIAHRLSTIANADKIIVLDDGRVAESGTHGELLAINGLYRNLWDTQQEELERRQPQVVGHSSIRNF